VQVGSGHIYVDTQLGARINLMQHPLTFIQTALRDAARSRLMHHLQTRNADDKCPGRQDMSDITLHIDMEATTAMIKCTKKREEVEDVNDKPDCKLHRLHELSNQARRRLSTIIAGSIRTPARLAHSCKGVSATCNHPQCHGAKNDSAHIFWHCHRWNELRKPYLEAIHRRMAQVKRKSVARYNQLQNMLKNRTFQCCGLCPGDMEALKKAYTLNEQDQLRINCNPSELFEEHNDDTVEINGFVYSKIFTDGSCMNGTSRILARAGWGVYFGKD
jgi:hypothetical protein